MSRLPLSAAAAQVWAVEELVGERAQRRRQSGLRGQSGLRRQLALRWQSAQRRLMAWPRLAPSAQPRPALAEQSRRPGRSED